MSKSLISVERFGSTPGGEEVVRYTLRNAEGMTVRVISLGGIIQEIWAPDRGGVFADVVLGQSDLAGYLGDHPHYGAITGRFANRIAGGVFRLDGEVFPLPKNENDRHTLHGGNVGFSRRVWSGETFLDGGQASLRLSYTSPHGEDGFPGRLETSVTYCLTAENELRIDYEATTDRPTILNLTNHSYFNLGGFDQVSARDHEVFIRAPLYVPVDREGIPTGEIRSVEGTVFDLRSGAVVGDRLAREDPNLAAVGGFDHTFVFGNRREEREFDARLIHPLSGRSLDILTSEPGVQFYSGNMLEQVQLAGKNGSRPGRNQGLCLETQHFPDSPNQPHFPSVRLDPGEVFRSWTRHRFGAL